jgi:hypothetical protein
MTALRSGEERRAYGVQAAYRDGDRGSRGGRARRGCCAHDGGSGDLGFRRDSNRRRDRGSPRRGLGSTIGPAEGAESPLQSLRAGCTGHHILAFFMRCRLAPWHVYARAWEAYIGRCRAGMSSAAYPSRPSPALFRTFLLFEKPPRGTIREPLPKGQPFPYLPRLPVLLLLPGWQRVFTSFRAKGQPGLSYRRLRTPRLGTNRALAYRRASRYLSLAFGPSPRPGWSVVSLSVIAQPGPFAVEGSMEVARRYEFELIPYVVLLGRFAPKCGR